jgi:hypothetical protein
MALPGSRVNTDGLGINKMETMAEQIWLTGPLHVCVVEMAQEEQSKNLGDQLCGLGMAEFVATAVEKRRGLVIR